MSHYEKVYITKNPKFCCKYCVYFTFDKKLIKKHLCEDKIDMIKFDKEFKEKKKKKMEEQNDTNKHLLI